jgi:LytS/YehU family sensor histidine kinase
MYRLLVRSEQKALRAQVNPHFIFNAMNSVLELITDQQYKKASDYLLHFSVLMRRILENSRKEEVVLEQEIDLLNRYMQMERLRFRKEIDCRIEIGPGIDAQQLLVPSMLIQPYVENAFKHGLRHRNDENGRIEIRVVRVQDTVKVTISDNGPGIADAVPKRKKSSLGMLINEERIKLSGSLHTSYTVSIRPFSDNPADEFPGTSVTLTFPYKTTHYDANPDRGHR